MSPRDVADGRLRQLPPTANLPAINIQPVTHPARRLNRAEAVLSHEIADVPLAERSYG